MSIPQSIVGIRLSVARLVDTLRSSLESNDCDVCQPELSTLEQRIMFSATPMAPAEQVEVVDAECADSCEAEATENSSETSGEGDQPPAAISGDVQVLDVDGLDQSDTETDRQLELVFIDPGAENYDSFLADLYGSNESNRTFEVFVLDKDRDGIDQITEALNQYEGVDAIHLVSHGSNGTVQLGATNLDASTLASRGNEISGWGDQLDTDADLLIYGCNLASGEEGQELIRDLAVLCSCDVAASDDVTGHEELGGDWDLEFQVGEIQSDIAFSSQLQDQWHGLLDVTTGLVLHLDFNEGSGSSVDDSSPYDNDGSLAGSPDPSFVTGIDGTALDFSGSDDQVIVSDDSSLDFGSSDFSVSLSFSSSDTPGSTAHLIDKSDDGDEGFRLFFDSSGDLNFQVDDDSSSITLKAAGLLDGNWHHVAAVREGNLFRLYVDGSLVDSETVSIGSIDNGRSLRIGTDDDESSNFDGLIDEVSLFDRALTAGDVQALAQSITATQSAFGGLTINEGASNNAYLQAETGFSTAMSSFTVEVQFEATDSSDVTTLFSYNTASGDMLTMNTYSGTGHMELDFGTGGSATSSVMDYRTLLDGTKHTLSFTWDNTAGDWEIFVDGVSVDSGTGQATGQTIETGGVIILGIEQDSVGGGLDRDQILSGTLYDVRVFDDVRSNGEIAANYDQDVAYDEGGLVFNWLFDNLSSDGVITEAVSGNNLTVKYLESGTFTPGTPYLKLQVDEHSSNGTVIGSITGLETDRNEQIDSLLAADSDLRYSAETGKFYKIVNANVDWSTALTNATGTNLSGISGELVVIESASENALVRSYANSIGDEVWLGASDQNVADDWYWYSGGSESTLFWQGDSGGSAQNGAYTNWDSGYPNSSPNNFVRLDSTDGTWRSVSNSESLSYVVQWDADTVLDVTDAITYSLTSNPNGAFAIDSDNGELTVANSAALDYIATGGSVDIDVQVSDGTHTQVQTLTVFLNDINQAPNASADPGDYDARVQSYSPAAYWRLGESSGTTVTDSSNSNDGTYYGVSLGTGGAISGDSDTAVSFSGGEHIEIAHSSDLELDEGTFQVWFRTSDITQDGSIFSKDASGFVNGGHLSAYLDTSGELEVRLQSASSSFTVRTDNATQAISENDWHHLAFTFGSGGMNLYVDGQLMDSDAYTGGLHTSSGGTGNTETLVIGASNQVSTSGTTDSLEDFFNGDLDEFAVIGSQLSGDEIQALFNDGRINYVVAEGGSLAVSAADGVLANDIDPEGDPMTAVLVSGPSNAASFTLNSDGSFNYTPTGDFNGTDSFTYYADDGNASNTVTVTIQVTAVNDAPVNTVPGTQTVAEETTTAIGGISISDVDAGGANMTTRLQVGNGSLNVTLSGSATISAGSNGSGDLTIQGSATDINATLASLTYTGDTDVVGTNADTLTVTTNDLGNTGSGGALQDVDNVQIDITAVNDAPINTVPGTQTVAEETTTAIGGISISDVDAAGANMTTRLQVGSGSLNVTLSGSATISAGSNGSGDLTIQGSATDINATLASLTYTGDTDVVGTNADTLTVTTNDLGNTGSGGALQDVDNVQIDITAVNDAPINTVPGTQTVAEETTTAIGGISISDVDAGGANMTTRLQVGNGSLNVTLSGSATISAGSNGSGDLTIQGSATDINATLASLTYTGDTDVVGTNADTLTVTTNDLGNTGSGGALQDVDNVQIDITAVNDAPINTVPGTQTVAEETTTAIGGISISDVDAAGANMTTRLQVGNGSLNVTLSGSATISAGSNGSGDLTIQGSATDINATLASLTYTGDTDVVGTNADTLTVTTNDLGNTGSGGALQDVDNVQIDITAVNDAPINTVPGTQTVAEETTTAIGGISISDVDAAGANMTTRLQVGSGSLNVTLSGSATISAGSNGSGDLTIQGSATDINATLASLTYTGDTDVVGTNADTLTVTTNDLGNTGSGGALQDVDNVQIDITAVNDAPINTVPGTQTVAEETTTAIGGISISDVDAGGANMTTRLQVGNGSLNVTLSGSATISAGSNGSGDLTIQGSATDINATLASLTYTGDTDVVGTNADTLTVTTNDLGNTGSGGALQDVDNVQIDITAVNDAPINTVPGTQTVAEETTTAIGGISISDVDAGGANMTTRLQVGNGSLNVTLSGSATISAGSNGSGDLTIQGSATDINATLASLTYTGDTDVVGTNADTLTVTTNDLGNTGSGGALQDVDNVQIDITAVNDAPINTVPGTQTVAEETTTAIGGISISDVDAAGANMTTRLQVGNGSLNVTLSGSATISAGSNGSGDLTIQGSATDINATLASLTYTGDTDVVGTNADTLTVTTNDLGNTGSGGALQDVDNVQIDITAVNDAPINTVPGTQTVAEETTTAIGGISISDVDAGGANVTTRLQVGNGSLNVTLSGSATISAGSNGSGDLTIQGSATDINATLASLTYTGDTDVVGTNADTLTVTTNDLGNTGSGGALQDVDNVQIDITAVNDAPINTVPGTQTVAEETTTAIGGISISDVDAGGANMTTRLQVGYGALNVTLSGSATISAGANGSGDLTIQGSATDINATLASLTYTGDTDVVGTNADTLTVTTNDLGNTGSGGALQDVDNVQIDITAVNDAPINTVPGTQTVAEETTTAIGGISISDVDAAGANMTTRLQVGNGSLNVTLSGSATISAGSNGSGDLTIQGSATDINATLASLTYTGDTDVVGTNADTLTVTTNDLGNTGSGGALQDVDNVQIDITAVNDAPINTVPGTQTVAEETTTAIGGISISDVDAGGANMTTRLQVANGSLNVTLSGSATISAGSNGSGDLTIQGSATDINATLASLTYTGDTDVVGTNADTLTVTTNDLGNTGSGGALQDVDNVQIDITAVNDAPINTVPGTQTVAEETTTAIGGISISDVDAGGANMTTRLQVGNGALNVTLSGSATISAGSNGSGDLTIQGSATDINATLASLTYTGDTDVVGTNADTLTVTTNDLGNTGSGGALQDVDNVQIDITAVNDAPVITFQGGGAIANVSMSEGNTLVGTVTATDVDIPADTLSYTISGGADGGQFSIGNLDGQLRFNVAPGFATPSDANLDNIYEVEVTVDDGNAGFDVQLIRVTVLDTNQAPIITSNGGGSSATLLHDENNNFVTRVAASDVDLPGDTLSYSIVGGTDAAQFTIDGLGNLSFIATPDFETATDANLDGEYEVSVRVTDGSGATDEQLLRVRVEDVLEAPAPIGGGDEGDGGGDEARIDEPVEDPVTEEASIEEALTPADEPIRDTAVSAIRKDANDRLENKFERAREDADQDSNNARLIQAAIRQSLDTESIFVRTSDWSPPSRDLEKSTWDSGDIAENNRTPMMLSESVNSFGIKEKSEDAESFDWGEEFDSEEVAIGSMALVSSSVSVGYVLWLIRGGSLFVSALSSIPTWRSFDPLPIIESFEAAGTNAPSEELGESLDSLASGGVENA